MRKAGFRLQCESCALEHDATTTRTSCACGGLLELVLPDPGVRGEALARRFALRRQEPGPVAKSGVWRFLELVLPGDTAGLVSLQEGNTALLESPSVARWTGLEAIQLKHEGWNPTGSFKDRGMTVAMTRASRLGVPAVACASTGNTAASLAAYAARAGLPALVLVPATNVARGKLAQALAAGARTVMVEGDFDDCLALVRHAEEAGDLYLLNSVNPFRLAGQKTIVLELLEQLGWAAPDWIAFPAGNLGNTAAFGAALREAHGLGLIDRIPRLLAVQAAGAAPFAAGFAAKFAERPRVKPETIATAIRIGDPASWDRGVRSIRETNGIVAQVSDEDILEAKGAIDAGGIGCEPASAAGVAGVRQLVQQGVIRRDDTVVAVLTGHLLKDPEILLRAETSVTHPPVRIKPDVDLLRGIIQDVSGKR